MKINRLILGLLLISLVSGCGSSSSNKSKPGNENPTTPPTAAELAFANADGINGGRLYSKFWAPETGFDIDTSPMAGDMSKLGKVTSRSDFFRCKQCHGWDRLGREGGYSDRAPKTSRPNVSAINLAQVVASASNEELFNGIKTGSGNRRGIDTDLSTYDPAGDPSMGDMMPDYSELLTDAQIWDLVKYLKNEGLSTENLYDTEFGDGAYPERSRSFSNIGKDGDEANGDLVYANNCARCHGPSGAQILVDGGTYTVGAHTRKKPYEDQHKVKFGHLGSNMGSILAGSSEDDIRDLLKALSNASKYPDDPIDVDAANGINGGRLYSKFWATETGFTLENSELGGDQAKLDRISNNSDFFRCKQCHGWDRLGREGGYSNRAPKTTRPNVSPINLASIAGDKSSTELFNMIKNGSGAIRRDIDTDLSGYDPQTNSAIGDQMPDYSQILTDKQIEDIAEYLKTESLETRDLYDITLEDGVAYPDRARTFSNIGKDGDSAKGLMLYKENCSRCHGDDGMLILVDGAKYSVGQHVRLKPYEDQHKVKFGHLGSTMWAVMAGSSVQDFKDLFKALSDDSVFPDAPSPAAAAQTE